MDCCTERCGQSVAKILRFFDFSRWRRPPSWIFEIVNFYLLTVFRGPRSITDLILSKLVVPLHRCCNFSNFQDGGWPNSQRHFTITITRLYRTTSGYNREYNPKFTHDYTNQWDKLIPYVHFVLRSVPHSSMGVRRKMRGILQVIRETWTGRRHARIL